MAQQLTVDDDRPSFVFLLIDSLAFFLRNQLVFWIAALPIAGLAAGLAYLLDTDQRFVDWRGHWSWDFLFALIYAMFLDRWIKETLLDEASPCDEIDELRRATIAVRFLALAAALFVLAMMFSLFQFEGIAETLEDWQVPHGLSVVAGTVLTWLPHVFFWAAIFAPFALMLPALSAGEPTGLRAASRLGRPTGGTLFALIFGAALLSLVAAATTVWGLQVLPRRPWAAAAMVGAGRLFDCLLLTFAAYTLAILWRRLTGWQPPEPDDHPFRGMAKRVRGPA